MIAIIDYGVGNLRSVQKAFEARGHAALVTADPGAIRAATHVVLPGVGAFGAAVDTLRETGLEPVALEAARSGRPFLGICVGMQMLFDASEEMGEHRGLGLIPGRVVRFDPGESRTKIPQIGWNSLSLRGESPLMRGLPSPPMAYFVHSYKCVPEDPTSIAAVTEFCGPYASAVSVGSIHGVQFHPEKSSDTGLAILDNFARCAHA